MSDAHVLAPQEPRCCLRCGKDNAGGKEGYCKRCAKMINEEFERYRRQQPKP